MIRCCMHCATWTFIEVVIADHLLEKVNIVVRKDEFVDLFDLLKQVEVVLGFGSITLHFSAYFKPLVWAIHICGMCLWLLDQTVITVHRISKWFMVIIAGDVGFLIMSWNCSNIVRSTHWTKIPSPFPHSFLILNHELQTKNPHCPQISRLSRMEI